MNKNIVANITIEEVVDFSLGLVESVRRLTTQLDKDHQMLTDADLKEILKSDTTHLLLARDENGRIVGMTTLVIYRIPYKKTAWIEDVVVEFTARKKGIGTQLLKKAILIAKENQVMSLNLTSSPFREDANRLYQDLGFKKRETNVYRLTP